MRRRGVAARAGARIERDWTVEARGPQTAEALSASRRQLGSHASAEQLAAGAARAGSASAHSSRRPAAGLRGGPPGSVASAPRAPRNTAARPPAAPRVRTGDGPSAPRDAASPNGLRDPTPCSMREESRSVGLAELVRFRDKLASTKAELIASTQAAPAEPPCAGVRARDVADRRGATNPISLRAMSTPTISFARGAPSLDIVDVDGLQATRRCARSTATRRGRRRMGPRSAIRGCARGSPTSTAWSPSACSSPTARCRPTRSCSSSSCAAATR